MDLEAKGEAQLFEVAVTELKDGLQVDVRVAMGEPAEEIVRVAREEAVDLIVIVRTWTHRTPRRIARQHGGGGLLHGALPGIYGPVQELSAGPYQCCSSRRTIFVRALRTAIASAGAPEHRRPPVSQLSSQP
jgi:hypothetical protein